MPVYVEKAASADEPNVKIASDILEKIYQESPWKWPHGLTLPHHDDLYIIRKQANDEPIGFVGWQVRDRLDGRVGHYTIGVLPEYRNERYGREAVSSLLEKKSAEVDKVEALIVEGNKESEHLAKAVGVDHKTLEKTASPGGAAAKGWEAWKALSRGQKAWDIASRTGSAALTAGLLDVAVNKDKGAVGAMMGNPGADKWTYADFLINLGAGASKYMPAIGLAAMKTVGTPAVRHMGEQNDIFREMTEKMQDQAPAEGMPNWQKALLGAGLLGVGGLGAYGLHRLAKGVQGLNEPKPSVKLRLPTTDPHDMETTISMPMKDIHLSNRTTERLGRDTRRKLRQESKDREAVERQRRAQRKRELARKKLERAKARQAAGEEQEEMPKAASGTPSYGSQGAGTPMAPTGAQQAQGGAQGAPQAPPTHVGWATNQTLAQGAPPPVPPEFQQRLEELSQKVEELTEANKSLKSAPTQGAGTQAAATVAGGGEQVLQRTQSAKEHVKRILGRKSGGGKSTMSAGTGLSTSASTADSPIPKVSRPTSHDLNTAWGLANTNYRPHLVGGRPTGIYAPSYYRQMPLGRMAHTIGSGAKRMLSPTRPSGKVQFRDGHPRQSPWQQVLPMLLQGLS
jgi:RimJ/RimL family protein N-acetyltransferase